MYYFDVHKHTYTIIYTQVRFNIKIVGLIFIDVQMFHDIRITYKLNWYIFFNICIKYF